MVPKNPIITPTQDLICQVCGKNYGQRKSAFKQDISRCGKEKRHLCPNCDYRSHSKQNSGVTLKFI